MSLPGQSLQWLVIPRENGNKMFHVKHFQKFQNTTGRFMSNRPVNVMQFYWKKTRRQLYKSGSQQLKA